MAGARCVGWRVCRVLDVSSNDAFASFVAIASNAYLPPTLCSPCPSSPAVDWRDFAVVLTADYIPRLPQILSELNPAPRLCTIRRFRSLFTVEGTFRYILAVLSHYSLSLEKGNRGKERQPR